MLRGLAGALILTSSSLAISVQLSKRASAQAPGGPAAAPTLPEVTVESPKPQAKAPPKAASKAARSKAKAPPPKQVAQPAPAPAPGPVVDGAEAQGGNVSAGEGLRSNKPASQATDTPLATQTTGEGIRRNEISNITDLGNTTEPGVEFSDRTDGPNIRGMEGPRVSTVVDGITLPYLENAARGSTASISSPTNADGGGAAFDFFAISALDVLRGADSSRLGSGIFGGALVIRTLEPEDIMTDGRNAGGLSKITYDSRDQSLGGGLAVAARAGSVTALLQGTYRRGHETDNQGDNGSYGVARTEPNPLDYDQTNLLFKLRNTTYDGHRFGVTVERYNRDTDYDIATNWNRTPALTGYDPFNYFGHEMTGRKRASLDYNYVSPVRGAFIDTAFATAYWQNVTRDTGADGTQRNGTYFLRDIAFEHDEFGFVGSVNGNVWTGALRHNWKMGVDVSSFTVTQFTTVVPPTSLHSQADTPKVDGEVVGIYIDDRISIGHSRFALTPGLRFDWHEYTPKSTPEFEVNTGAGLFGLPPSNSNSRVTPKLLATYQVADKVELFAQWSAAYRAPTVSELYNNFTNPGGGYAQIGNPDLKPETGHGIEIGTNFGDRYFGGRIAAFQNWYKDFILADADPTLDPNFPGLFTGVFRFRNIDEVEIRGIEAKAHKRFYNGFIVHGGLAYTYGKDGDGNLLPTIAPFKGIIGVGYDRETWGVDLTGIFVGKYRDDFGDPTRVDTTFDAPSYAIANLSAWWEPAAINGMRLQASVKNLFDETYYDALSVRSVNLSSSAAQPVEFYSSPGRSFILSLTQKF